jgi:hypothetical protein
VARLKKKFLVYRDIPPESDYTDPRGEGRRIGYRHVLVDWLNRGLSGGSADRKAAERVGTLIHRMQDSTVKYLKTLKWSLSNTRGDEPGPEDAPGCESFLEIACSYDLEFDMLPGIDGKNWMLVCRCMKTPSGEVYAGGIAAPELGARWDGQDSICNPEGMAVDAVIFTALDGLLGTIRRCEVDCCRKWFLTKDDPRIRCCPDHNVDVLRKSTQKRIEQVRAAAKVARDRARDEEKKHWQQSECKDKSYKPGAHRIEKSRPRPGTQKS